MIEDKIHFLTYFMCLRKMLKRNPLFPLSSKTQVHVFQFNI